MLDLKKNDSVLLCLDKKDSNLINVGLGWDTRADLDVHAILRDEKGKELGEVYYGWKSVTGVRLSGDNLTGDGDGDDEIIYIDREAVPSNVHTVSIYVNIYSGISNFSQVEGGFIRIYDDCKEHARATLDVNEIGKCRAVHFADLILGDDLTFKIIMNGGNMQELRRGYKSMQQINNKANEEPKKKKKFLGLF